MNENIVLCCIFAGGLIIGTAFITRQSKTLKMDAYIPSKTARHPNPLIRNMAYREEYKHFPKIEEDSFSKNQEPDVTKVILVTYYRGGSTFLSSIFWNSPSSMYWFEPGRLFMGPLEGDNAAANTSGGMNTAIKKMVPELLNCKLNRVNMQGAILMLSRQHELKKQLEELGMKRRCYRQNPVLECVPGFKPECHQKSLRIVKTIRAETEMQVIALIESNPGAYFIHSVRDIRSTLSSRLHLEKKISNNIKERFQRVTIGACQRMVDNYQLFERMRAAGHHNFMNIFYEDIASNTIESAERLYRFIGRKLPEVVRKRLTSSTHFNGQTSRNPRNSKHKWVPDKQSYGVVRTNSTDHIVSWKRSMTVEEAKYIEKECRDYFKFFSDKYDASTL